MFLREGPDLVVAEDVVLGVVGSDEAHEFLLGRGNVENCSPREAFCLFRVPGWRRFRGAGLGVLLPDILTSVSELSVSIANNDDVGMMSVGWEVEGGGGALDSTGVDDDGMKVDSSIFVGFLGDFCPVEAVVGCLKKFKEIFFGEVLDLGISEEVPLGVQKGMRTRHYGRTRQGGVRIYRRCLC